MEAWSPPPWEDGGGRRDTSDHALTQRRRSDADDSKVAKVEVGYRDSPGFDQLRHCHRRTAARRIPADIGTGMAVHSHGVLPDDLLS
jgi:hypothetical protein